METIDTNLGKASDVVDEDESQDCIIIEQPQVTTKTISTNLVNRNFGKRILVTDGSKRPQKRPDRTSKGITNDQREQTAQLLQGLLEPLVPPEDMPDLIDCTAKRLESDLFNRISNGGPVNTLGRGSALLTAGRKQDISEKYIKEKEKLFQKVRKYVETATKNDVVLEQVQQGEIWDVIKDILNGN